MKQAYVIFQDSPAWYVWPFKKNFRHVAVVIRQHDSSNYIHINFRAKTTEVKVLDTYDVFKLDTIAEPVVAKDGIRVVRVVLEEEQGFNLPLPFNCVETVKRIIGVRKWWVVTPHQLYRYLIKHY